MKLPRHAALCFMLAALAAPAAQAMTEPQIVNVYSYRQPFLIKPLFDDFTARTGIRVQTVFAKKGLIERIAIEGKRSPADVLLTVDIGRVSRAGRDIGRRVESRILERHIPPQFRDPERRWFGLTRRARVIYAARDRVKRDALTYEELTAPEWRGRICTRSGRHPYNVALFAALIVHHGEDWVKNWLTGLKANLAQKPSGNDRAQVKRVAAGVCDIALGNTYYMGQMETNDTHPEQKAWAAAVRLIFPNSETRGTHVNISGMVMARHAPHPENAYRLMEYLASKEAQRLYAEVNFEYPVRADVKPSPRVAGWGDFTPDPLPLARLAAGGADSPWQRAAALVDETGFDRGPE